MDARSKETPAPVLRLPGRDAPLQPLQIAQLLLVALAALIALFRVVASDFMDDAYITFSYARNIAEGQGFVFSERYDTWGTTTPLFTLLLAFFNALGLAIPPTARFIDAAALLGQAAIVVFIFRALDLRNWAPLALFVWAGTWWLSTSFPGMEYGLYTAFSVGAVTAILPGQWLLAALLASLAATTRPDGALVAGLVGAAWLLHTRGRERPALFAVCLLAVPLVWYLFAALQFGRLTPQTLETRQFESGTWGRFLRFWLRYQFNPLPHAPAFPVPNLFLLTSLVGFFFAAWRRPRFCWLLLYFFAYAGLYTFFGLPGLPQYLCPLNLIAIVGSVAGLGFALHSVRRPSFVPALAIVGAYIACGFLVFTISFFIVLKEFRRHEIPAKWEAYAAITRWMNEALSPDTPVATNEIGYLGYYADVDLIELGGLVNKEAFPHYRRAALEDYLAEIRAPFVVLPVVTRHQLDREGPSFFDEFYIQAIEIPTWDYGPVALYVQKDYFSSDRLADISDTILSHARNIVQGIEPATP